MTTILCKSVSVAVLLTMFSFAIQTVDGQAKKTNPVKTLTYSQMLRQKERYLGKKIRLKATWIEGVETSFLCETICGKLEEAWVELGIDRSCKNSDSDLWKSTNEALKGAEVVVRGILEEAKGQYKFGHMGAYNFRFIVTCVEKFKRRF